MQLWFTFYFSLGVVKEEFCISVEIKVLPPLLMSFVSVLHCRVLSKKLLAISSPKELSPVTSFFLILVSLKQPKCGFLPVSSFISEENIVKRSTIRFKMHQALKLHQRKVTVLNSYIFFLWSSYMGMNGLISCKIQGSD